VGPKPTWLVSLKKRGLLVPRHTHWEKAIWRWRQRWGFSEWMTPRLPSNLQKLGERHRAAFRKNQSLWHLDLGLPPDPWDNMYKPALVGVFCYVAQRVMAGSKMPLYGWELKDFSPWQPGYVQGHMAAKNTELTSSFSARVTGWFEHFLWGSQYFIMGWE
jgi:hypothetical protein